MGPCPLVTEAGDRCPHPGQGPTHHCPPVTFEQHWSCHCGLFAPKHEGKPDREMPWKTTGGLTSKSLRLNKPGNQQLGHSEVA